MCREYSKYCFVLTSSQSFDVSDIIRWKVTKCYFSRNIGYQSMRNSPHIKVFSSSINLFLHKHIPYESRIKSSHKFFTTKNFMTFSQGIET